jgi:hydroxymethylpyrimidine/phosphomethylpyrimidine kinase
VVLKGGHLPGDWVVDLLAAQDGLRRTLESPRIATHNGHGTGCTLSSAIASTWPWACRWPMPWRTRAAISWKRSVRAAVRTGHGHGPLNHGHAPVAQIIRPN